MAQIIREVTFQQAAFLPDWNPAAGGIRAFYFRDPDRHVLEVIWFPPGKGAHLRITTVRAARGPGVELLEYLAPKDGRAYPADARPNDLLHWQTTLVAPVLDEAADAVRTAGAPFVSRGTAVLEGSRLGRARAVLVRDPDGHALLLTQPDKDPVITRSAR